MLRTFTYSHDGAFLPSSGILPESDGMHNLAPMAQRHSSPSPMWLIVVSSAVAVVTLHCGPPQPSSSSSASSITSPPPSPLYCRAFLLLLPPFSIAVTIAETVSVFLLHLHRFLFDCCVLSVIVVVRCRVVSLLLLKILASTGALSSYPPLCSRSLVYLIVACTGGSHGP